MATWIIWEVFGGEAIKGWGFENDKKDIFGEHLRNHNPDQDRAYPEAGAAIKRTMSSR
jgi:hypothetical protein